ncbi:glucose-1-phosphate adenylyltransferase [Alteromonadaceae bacterium BrNp21-10]|nr:glucose-1-phosphate adenylyltransferase [Alteromonadaceae bacterium BrNp21-10]
MVMSSTRNVSQMTKNSLALILAGGQGSRLFELTQGRAKPALHFGGKFRVIDFPLSNCINSGIRKIGVITQYKAYSLIRHLSRGWSHLNRDLDEYVELLPASQQCSSSWYQGTADALYQNIEFIRSQCPQYVVVLGGDHIYKMDYGSMLAQHVESGAELTVSCIEVPLKEAAGSFGVVGANNQGRILCFKEKPDYPCMLRDTTGHTLASMGNYVFNTDFLLEQLEKDAANADSSHDLGKDIIPALIKTAKVFAYRYRDENSNGVPYWRDVGTLDSFWQANMDLVALSPKLNIYDDGWPIWTYQKQSPPAKFVFNDDGRRGNAVNSMISGGCIVSGASIIDSLLFTDVRVNSYSDISESVVLPRVEIGRNVSIKRAIIDSDCKIPPGMQIGFDPRYDQQRGFRVTENGVVLVTQSMLNRLKKLNIDSPCQHSLIRQSA